MNENLQKSIIGKKSELDKHRPLSPSILRKLEEQFSLEFTYNSNAIEGNTLTLQETEIILKNGITIGGKSVNEHLEAINHQNSINFIKDLIHKKEDISIENIKKLHKIILTGIDDLEAGVFRRQNVRIIGARIIPPQSIKVPRLIEEFENWYYENKKVLIPFQMACEIHYRFVCIHPFIDGNGRVSRLLMNLYLMNEGFPPAVILKVDRKRYYRVLNEANIGNPENYENFIGRAIERSLIIYLNSIKPDLSEKQGLIPLKEAAKFCDYSQEYLSFLARTGKLSAIKQNKEWLTTREAIEEYILQHSRKEH